MKISLRIALLPASLLALATAAMIVAGVAHAQSTFNKYQPANGVQCNTGLTFIDTACGASAIPAAGSTTQMIYNLAGVYAGNAQATVASDLGLVIGAATGGSKGPGTINATAMYINGSAVGTSSGAVSSVGLSLPGIFTVTGSPVTAAGTLTGSLNTQTANTIWAGPTSGGAATPTFRSMVIADVPTIPAAHTSGFATVATSGAYSDLSGTPTIPTAANPTGSIGLSTVNGSAATFMRSDGHPALDQSISPTMTGTWLFDGAATISTGTSGVSPGLNAGNPFQSFINSSGGTDSKIWMEYAGVTTFNIATDNDAFSSVHLGLSFTRSSATITSATLGNTTDYPAIGFDGTTTIINGGVVGSTLNIGTSVDTTNAVVINSKGTGSTNLTLNANGIEAIEMINNQSGSTLLGVPTGAVGIGDVSSQPFYFGGMSVIMKSPGSGISLTVNTPGGGSSGVSIVGPAGTANSLATGATLSFGDASSVSSIWSNNGGQTELWQFNSAAWNEVERVTTARAVEFAAPSGGPFAVCTTVTCGAVLFQVQNSGSIGMPFLGTSTAAQTGYLCWSSSGGALTVDSTNTCLVSSIRYKKNVKPLEFGLDAVMKLRPISYEYKDGFMPDKFNPGRQDGFIAEEVQKVDPRLTPLDTEGKPKSVEYAQMSAMLVRAIQDQQQEIWELRVALGALAVVSLTWLSALTWKRRHGH